MARGEKSKTVSRAKDSTRKTQRKLQRGGSSKRTAEKRAWEDNRRNGVKTRSSGTASGRSRVSKRTLKPKAGKSKSKTAGKTRR